MFCENCGKEIYVTAKVCPNCGTPVVPPVSNQAVYHDQNDKKLKIMCAVVAVLHVLQIILWFTPYITLSASVYGMSRSESFSMANTIVETETPQAFTPIFVILFAVGAVFAALPIFTGIMKKRRRMIISKIISVITVLFVLLTVSLINSATRGGVSCSLAFTGLIFVLIPIAIFVLTVLVSRSSKKLLNQN